MNKLIILCLVFSGCGYSARQNTGMGQVKIVSNETPIFCSDRNEADISLGVIVKGVGSMSSHDMIFLLKDKDVYLKLKQASESGKLVKFSYDVKRFRICGPDEEITSVEYIWIKNES